MSTPARSIPRRPYAKRLPDLVSGPYIGMHDSLDPSLARPNIAKLLQNVYPLDRQGPSVVIGRVGAQAYDFTTSTTGSHVQGAIQFTKLDGTEISVFVLAGELWEFDWTTLAVEQNVTPANLLTAGIGNVSGLLNQSDPVFLVVYNDQLVVSDGEHTPFMWDGTAGAGGLTELANAPIAYGQPVVYFGRLFFIKDTEPNVIVWSEVNDAETGYEAGGFNNAWGVTQTQEEAFVCMVPTNNTLYLARSASITAAFGDPATFTSTPTTEAVSQTVGVGSARGAYLYENSIYFVDRRGRPYAYPIGGRVTPLWEPFRNTLAGYLGDAAPSIVKFMQVVYAPNLHLIICAIAHPIGAFSRLALVLDPESGRALSVFRTSDESSPFNTDVDLFFGAIGLFRDDNGHDRTVYGIRHNVTNESAIGVAGLPNSTTDADWTDVRLSTTVPILHVVETGPVGQDSKYQKLFDRADVTLHLQDTSVDTYQVKLLAQTPSDADMEPDDSGLTVSNGDPVRDAHFVWGLNRFGRWLSVMAVHLATAEPEQRFGLRQFVLQATATHSDHSVK